MPTLKYKNGTTWTTIPTGVNAGFGTPTATINNVVTSTANPAGCDVEYSGADSARSYKFSFKNMKGSQGATGGTGPQGYSGNYLGYVTRRRTTNLTLPYLAGATNAYSMAMQFTTGASVTGDGTLSGNTRGAVLTGSGFIGLSAMVGLTNMTIGTTSVYTYMGGYPGTSFPSSWTSISTWQGKDMVMYTNDMNVCFPEIIIQTSNANTIFDLLCKCYGVSGTQAAGYYTNLWVVKYA